MDLTFIGVPTSKEELLELLRIAYNAGQESINVPIRNQIVTAINTGTQKLIEPTPLYDFDQWISGMAQYWEDLKHS